VWKHKNINYVVVATTAPGQSAESNIVNRAARITSVNTTQPPKIAPSVGRVWLCGFIRSQHFATLIDTGSDSSFIDADLAKKLNFPINLCPGKISLADSNVNLDRQGVTDLISLTALFSLDFGSDIVLKSISHKFELMNLHTSNYQFIIGTDLIKILFPDNIPSHFYSMSSVPCIETSPTQIISDFVPQNFQGVENAVSSALTKQLCHPIVQNSNSTTVPNVPVSHANYLKIFNFVSIFLLLFSVTMLTFCSYTNYSISNCPSLYSSINDYTFSDQVHQQSQFKIIPHEYTSKQISMIPFTIIRSNSQLFHLTNKQYYYVQNYYNLFNYNLYTLRSYIYTY
jgi:hypothetical protein